MDEKIKFAIKCGFLGGAIGSVATLVMVDPLFKKQQKTITTMHQDFLIVKEALTVLMEEGSFEGSTLHKVHEMMEFRSMTRDL